MKYKEVLTEAGTDVAAQKYLKRPMELLKSVEQFMKLKPGTLLYDPNGGLEPNTEVIFKIDSFDNDIINFTVLYYTKGGRWKGSNKDAMITPEVIKRALKISQIQIIK